MRDVVDTDLGTADELLPLVSSARDVSGARQLAAERIRTMIKGIGSLGGSSGGLAGRLREELKGHEEMGLYVLTTLMEVEERSSRLSHLLEAWCERIGQFVRAGDFDAAATQLGAGRKGATTQHKTELLEEALGEFVVSEIELLVDSFQNEEQRPALVELLAGFGEPTTARLMQRLAQEESPVARRALIGILAGVAAVYLSFISAFCSVSTRSRFFNSGICWFLNLRRFSRLERRSRFFDSEFGFRADTRSCRDAPGWPP